MENKIITTAKGLYLDVPKNSQPDGTYSFALNAVDLSDEGESFFIGNEPGNISSYDFPSGYLPIGHIALINDDVLIFLGKINGDGGQIGLGDKFGNYTVLITNDEFDFSFEEQTQGIVSTINGCERKIYFRAPKLWAINIDNLDQYLNAGETVATANASGTGWTTSLMRWFPSYTTPVYDEITVNDNGGDLPLGTYQVITTYLDADLNEIGWMDMSNPAPVVDESFSGDFDAIDGGTNALYPPTQKSITIELSDIDTSFSYLRIAVVASNDGVRTAYKITDAPITGDTLSYTITSITSTDVIEITISSIVVNKIVYEEAQTVAQTENRALLGNVKEKQIDYASFQRVANDIQSHWFSKEVFTTTETPNVKSPDMFLERKGYMSDEVYAFGIVYYFDDGYITPVFHIPGRESNTDYQGNVMSNVEPNPWHNRFAPVTNWDTELYDFTAFKEEVKQIGITDANPDIGYGNFIAPRWMVFNTATRYATPNPAYSYEGEMAYWESTLDYPNSVDCDGNRVFPEGKVRYHKFPDVTLVPHNVFDDTENVYKTYPLGIKFENITFPAEYSNNIIGYKIVRVKRTSTNSSILDKGMFTRVLTNVNLIDGSYQLWQTYPYNGNRNTAAPTVDNNYQVLHSPKTKFERNYLGGNHVKYDQKLATAQFPAGEWVDYTTAVGTASPVQYRSQARFKIGDADSNYTPSITNRTIEIQSFVDADTVLNNVFDSKFNNTEQQEAFVLKMADTVPDPNTEVLMRGYNEDNPVYFYYGAIKKYIPQQYNLPNANTYISCSSSYRNGSSTEEYGGDTFISRLYFRKCARVATDAAGGWGVAGVPVNDDVAYEYTEKHLLSFYVESTINVGYRHEGIGDTEVYYPKSYSTDVDAFLDLEVTLDLGGSGIDDDLIPNYYAYNSDYSQENDVKVYFMLSSSFAYCYDCNNEFKTRIAYSEVQSSEGIADAWTIFKANNYRDLPFNKGEITNLFLNNDKLYAHTLQSLFLIPTSQQTIQTDESQIFLGNSTFFSLGPVELKNLNEGYLGSNSQWATINTEYGTFFVSYDKIFTLSETLSEISDLGLRQFFIDNQILFKDSFRELMLDFSSTSTIEFPNIDNPANPYGIGWLATYDREKHRVILHKRDFTILFGLGTIESPIGFWGTKNEAITYLDGSIVWDADINWFTQYNEASNVFIRLNLSDTTLFENKSITISYDVKNKHWVSYHSYLPQYMFNTYSKWYSTNYSKTSVITPAILGNDPFETVIYNGLAWNHNNGEYQSYYGTVYPHMIELVYSQDVLNSSISKSFGYVSQARLFDSTYKQWKDVALKTFNRVWLYNDNQSSGYLSTVVTNNHVNPYIAINYSPTEVFLYKADKTWRLNSKRNNVSATNTVPISNSRWSDISSNYYIDKIPNDDAHDLTQSQYNIQKFRDKYITMRLILDDPDNHKVLTQYSFNNYSKSVR